MKATLMKSFRLARRIRRVRKKIGGGATHARLAVSRSNRNICAQIIDDTAGRTLCSASSQSKELRDQIGYGGNVKAASIVGKALGEKARELGIENVCFDRRGRTYDGKRKSPGRIEALAQAARDAGLKF